MANTDAAARPSPAKPEPKKIYMDQNIYGHMLDQGNGNWRKSPAGEVLERASYQDKGLVWIGPTHVMETVLTTEDKRRQDLARTMLEVIDFKRMWLGYELDVVTEFFDFLSHVSARSIRTRYFLEHEQQNEQRIWLGALAFLALGAPPSTSQADNVRRHKLENRLLHARFATDPNGWVDRMIRAAKGWQTTRTDVFEDIAAMDLDELHEEIRTLRERAKKPDKKHYDRLNKERAVIAATYGALDVSVALERTFVSPMSLDLTLDTVSLVADWPAFQAKASARSMPMNVVAVPPDAHSHDDAMRTAVIEVAIQTWASKNPLTATLSYESLLRELQAKLMHKELPTEGVIFDADHAGALRRTNVFYTEDKLFGSIALSLAELTSRITNGNHRPAVATSPDELATALGL